MKKLFLANALALSCLAGTVNAQSAADKKTSFSFWDGMAIAGYVDKGSYVNFGGPSIKFNKKPWSFGFGILPTMRIKKDNASKEAPKNSAITPTAGFGFTCCYKHLVVQVPFYYNAKTATANGKWIPGVGLGYKF